MDIKRTKIFDAYNRLVTLQIVHNEKMRISVSNKHAKTSIPKTGGS